MEKLHIHAYDKNGDYLGYIWIFATRHATWLDRVIEEELNHVFKDKWDYYELEFKDWE